MIVLKPPPQPYLRIISPVSIRPADGYLPSLPSRFRTISSNSVWLASNHQHKTMVSSKHLLYVIASLVASISALSQRSTEEFSLYAYGKGIGGEKVFYIDGGHTRIEDTSLALTRPRWSLRRKCTDREHESVSCELYAHHHPGSSHYPHQLIILLVTAPATDIATTASLTVSSATADIVGEYFAVNTNSNDPVTITTSGTTYTTDGYLFFNGVLVHSSPLQSRFYARPSSVGSYQIYWISDSSAVSTTDVPLAIRSNAPATASD